MKLNIDNNKVTALGRVGLVWWVRVGRGAEQVLFEVRFLVLVRAYCYLGFNYYLS